MTAKITMMIPIATLSPVRFILSNKIRNAPDVPRIRLKTFFRLMSLGFNIKYEKTATVNGNPDQMIEDKLE